MNKIQELKNDIAQLNELLANESTSADERKIYERQLADTEAELAAEEAKPKKPRAEQKTVEQIEKDVAERRKAKKEGKQPAKPEKKAATKDEGQAMADCEEMIRAARERRAAEKKRLSSRKKAGKPVELTPSEVTGKTVAKVAKKVAERKEKGRPVTKTEADAISDDIKEMVKIIKRNMKEKADGKAWLKSLISVLNRELKSFGGGGKMQDGESRQPELHSEYTFKQIEKYAEENDFEVHETGIGQTVGEEVIILKHNNKDITLTFILIGGSPMGNHYKLVYSDLDKERYGDGGEMGGNKKYIIGYVSCDVAKDDFEEGQDTKTYHDFHIDINKTVSSKDKVIDVLKSFMVSSDISNDDFEWDAESKSVHTNEMVKFNSRGEMKEPTKAEIEQWKAGKKTLYSAMYVFKVTPVYEADDFAKGGSMEKYDTLWYAIHKTKGDWDEQEQRTWKNITWKQAVEKAYELAMENKSEVRVSKSSGFNNQGHYFHWQAIRTK